MILKNYQASDTSLLLTSSQVQEYLQVGRDRAKEVAEKAGARVQFGNSVRYNRKKLDAYIESITEDSKSSAARA